MCHCSFDGRGLVEAECTYNRHEITFWTCCSMYFLCSLYFLCCSMYFCVVIFIVCFVSFSILFVCIRVLNYYPVAVKYIISFVASCCVDTIMNLCNDISLRAQLILLMKRYTFIRYPHVSAHVSLHQVHQMWLYNTVCNFCIFCDIFNFASYKHIRQSYYLVLLSFFLHWIRYGQCRSQWPRGLRRRSTAARLLRLWVRIPLGAWMFVCCECCVLSGDELITCPEESYRLWCVVVCDLETSWMRRPWPTGGCCAQKTVMDSTNSDCGVCIWT
jgi:hypothetical protein